MRWAEFALPAFSILLLGVIYEILPQLRKRNLYFGVTVDPEFRESSEGRSIAARYRTVVWISVLLTLAILYWAVQQPWHPLATLLVFPAVIACLAAWVAAWAKTRPHAQRQEGAVRSAPLLAEDEEDRLPGGWLTAFGPPAMVIFATAWLALHYDSLPERYPVHWGISGQPDRWVEKGWHAVTAPSAMGLAVILLVLGVTLMILRGAKRGSGGETNEFGARHRKANLQLLAALLWVMGPLFAAVTLLPVLAGEGNRAMLLLAFAPLLVILVMGFRLYRISIDPTGGSDGTPDDCWKLGVIYYNPNDPALMVEKRSGPGFTLNFGNRVSWALAAGLLVLILAPLILVR